MSENCNTTKMYSDKSDHRILQKDCFWPAEI